MRAETVHVLLYRLLPCDAPIAIPEGFSGRVTDCPPDVWRIEARKNDETGILQLQQQVEGEYPARNFAWHIARAYDLAGYRLSLDGFKPEGK